MSKKKISERFEPYLSELELIVPKSKLDDFKNIKKIIKESISYVTNKMKIIIVVTILSKNHSFLIMSGGFIPRRLR